MGVLSRQAIDAVRALAEVEVAVPALGGSVLVREMGAEDRDLFGIVTSADREASGADRTWYTRYRLGLLRRCLVGADGLPLYAAGEESRIGALPKGAVDVLFAAAEQVNGLSAGAVDDAAGKSVAAPSGSSSSGSASPSGSSTPTASSGG